jgi:hypothetical protein
MMAQGKGIAMNLEHPSVTGRVEEALALIRDLALHRTLELERMVEQRSQALYLPAQLCRPVHVNVSGVNGSQATGDILNRCGDTVHSLHRIAQELLPPRQFHLVRVLVVPRSVEQCREPVSEESHAATFPPGIAGRGYRRLARRPCGGL